MSAPRAAGTGVRFVVAALDHGAAAAGYAAVPEAPPPGGGWRRLYLGDGPSPQVAAVGPDDGGWASLGVEVLAPRDRVRARAVALLEALAPWEVAVDLDAGSDRAADEAVVRIALRVFAQGLLPGVVRDAVENLAEAAAAARRVLG